MAGLLQSILTGEGRQALLRSKIPLRIAANGALHEADPVFASAKDRALHVLKGMAVGDRPVDLLKQRYIQGGLFGKGGIVRGSLAPHQDLSQAIQDKGLLRGVAKHPMHALSAAMNNGFMVGIPGYASYKAVQRGDSPHLGQALGEGLAWTVGGPFGAAGSMIAGLGGRAGRELLSPKLPQMNAYPGMGQAYLSAIPPELLQSMPNPS